ncbi:hypothetical protein GBA52_010507 [Prunus armeniaca]|nr:hypothetical protein GBA52_010507 [Prunus armeniaca]
MKACRGVRRITLGQQGRRTDPLEELEKKMPDSIEAHLKNCLKPPWMHRQLLDESPVRGMRLVKLVPRGCHDE